MHKSLIVSALLCSAVFGQMLYQNPCSQAPFNCPQCTLYQNQCIQPTCLEKIARIGSPTAGVGHLDLDIHGGIQYVDVNGVRQLRVEINYADSESDPFELNSDGQISTCIQAVLYRLDNSYDLPHTQIGPIVFQRQFDVQSSRRQYIFYLSPDQISRLILLQSAPNQMLYQGNFVYEFQVNGIIQARYYFKFVAGFLKDMTDIIQSDFQGVREYDSLTCPSNQVNDQQCVARVESDLAFCLDFSFDCLIESYTSPELFINMDLYVAHKITSPGFNNWQLHLDQMQFYNVNAGYFQPITTGEYLYKPGRTVYKMRISFVQNSVTIGVNSKLIPPTGGLRRALQEDQSSKATAAQSQLIPCIKETESDKCPMPQSVIDKYSTTSSTTSTTSSNTQNTASQQQQQQNFKESKYGYMLIGSIVLLLLAII